MCWIRYPPFSPDWLNNWLWFRGLCCKWKRSKCSLGCLFNALHSWQRNWKASRRYRRNQHLWVQQLGRDWKQVALQLVFFHRGNPTRNDACPRVYLLDVPQLCRWEWQSHGSRKSWELLQCYHWRTSNCHSLLNSCQTPNHHWISC